MFFKENKFLISWGVIAIAVTLFSFHKPSNPEQVVISESGLKTPAFTFTENQKQELEELFNSLNKNQGFNGVVLVGQKDAVFFAKAYGWANFKTRDSMTIHSSFQLASVSKQFTAVAILQLYQQGKLQLTDTLQKYFPDFPHHGITIHHLLTHRSGLPNYHYFMQHLPLESDTNLNCQSVANEITQKNMPMYFKVNRRFQYSNTGYALLAAIVEKVSGMKFEDYLQKEIFTPLKMDDAFVYTGMGDSLPEGATTGYLYHWREASDNILDKVLGDKGIYASVIDLFKWDQGLYNNTIINYDTLQKAFEPMGKPKSSKTNYGYGWRMFEWPVNSMKVIYHAGWWHGYRSLIIRIQQDSTTIVVLKNRSQGARIGNQQILNILYPDQLKMEADTVQTTDSLFVSADEE